MMATDPLYQEDKWISHNLDLRPYMVCQKGLVTLVFYLLYFCNLQVSSKRADSISYLKKKYFGHIMI